MGGENSKETLKIIKEINDNIIDRLDRIELETKEMREQIKKIEEIRKENYKHNEQAKNY